MPGAYVLYRRRFPGRRLLRAVVTIPFVLPTVVVGVAFQSLLVPSGRWGSSAWTESLAAIVAALVFFNYSVVVRTVGVLWSRLDPRAEDAARSLGAGRLRVLATVTLPALAPAIASAAALVFLFCATAFGVVLVLGGQGYGTIETEIWYQTTQFLDLRAAAVLSILQLLVVSASLMVAGATRARQERALRLSGNPVDAPLRVADVPAVLVTAGVVGVLLFVPLGRWCGAPSSPRTAGPGQLRRPVRHRGAAQHQRVAGAGELDGDGAGRHRAGARPGADGQLVLSRRPRVADPAAG